MKLEGSTGTRFILEVRIVKVNVCGSGAGVVLHNVGGVRVAGGERGLVGRVRGVLGRALVHVPALVAQRPRRHHRLQGRQVPGDFFFIVTCIFIYQMSIWLLFG